MSQKGKSATKRHKQTEPGEINEGQNPAKICRPSIENILHVSLTSSHGDCAASGNIAEQFMALEKKLVHQLKALHFSEPVTHIYNPVEYAAEPHKAYVHRYCRSTKAVLFLGMNPGPYGMAQTGVPFGEVTMVKQWLQISGHVDKPENEHPKRPISGFDCQRKEVSGDRFWSLFRKLCGTADVFFRQCFVHNLCPLIFLNKTGRNLTPPELCAAERNAANKICERALCDIVRLLRVKTIIGVGKFAQKRAQVALKDGGIEGVAVEAILHPSPASPAANKGWFEVADRQLTDLGIMPYLSDQTTV